MSNPTARRLNGDGRSVPELLRELSSEGATLVRQEIALARAELNEKVDTYRKGSISMAAGGALLLAALFFFLWAINHALTMLLALVIAMAIAVWLAPLLLALTLGALGWSLFTAAKQQMSEEGLAPQETLETLREDRLWVQQKAREVKEEIEHG